MAVAQDQQAARHPVTDTIHPWEFAPNRRHGQVVRQRIANPLPPVRIWVPPSLNPFDIQGFRRTSTIPTVDNLPRGNCHNLQETSPCLERGLSPLALRSEQRLNLVSPKDSERDSFETWAFLRHPQTEPPLPEEN